MVWRTPKQRSQEYVGKIEKELQGKIVTNSKIQSIIRDENGNHIIDILNHKETFDAIVFACHPDQILTLLGHAASPLEQQNLSKFEYSLNTTYLHCDESLMPKNKAAWASWNYIGTSTDFRTATTKPVFVTYWLNRLQNFTHPKSILVSLNPPNPPAADKTFETYLYEHPQYTTESVKAQTSVSCMQGLHNTWYCGAWMGYGFHEDGIRSGLDVAVHITGRSLPWDKVNKSLTTADSGVIATSKSVKSSWLTGAFGFLFRPLISLFTSICESQVRAFLLTGFKKGKLCIILPTGGRLHYGSSTDPRDEVTIKVHSSWFWVRVALEYDLGMGRSYMAGEWEVVDAGANFEGLTKLLMQFISNMAPASASAKKQSGLSVSNMATAWLGSVVNMIWYRLTMDNSIANSQSHIHSVSLS